jgi:DNA polymerase (family 10)
MRANDTIADALGEYADLLAISAADPFRVRVYEKAARAIAGYDKDLENLDVSGLLEIPGVGRSVARKALACLEHGTFDELEEIRAGLPAGVRSLLSVPGLGPKRAKLLYDEAGIASVRQLLDALHAGELHDLRGFGERTEDNLLAALDSMSRNGGRIPLETALDIADHARAELADHPAVRRISYAGSLRRRRETVGDIDVLVASDSPTDVMDAVCAMPLTREVLAHGTTKSSVRTTKGVQIDVRVVGVDAWGAALQYFTGSKPHNIRLRRIAQDAGLKLSEYGLFDAEGRLVAARTEEDVYRRLGLDWVPPVLREDRGEIEAASRGELPTLVEADDLCGDLHTHTDLTDGVASMEAMVARAEALGYSYYAVTDHAPELFMQRMTAERALEQRAALARLAARSPVVLLHGSELNIAPDGSLDWDDAFLAGFDVLVASVHSRFTQPRAEMTRRVIRAIEHPRVNVIGHPMGRLLSRRPPVDVDADAVLRAAARHGTALEINGSPDRLDLDERLVRQACARGVALAIDSDAHAVPHLDNIRFGVSVAQRGWAGPPNVINTWPIDRLRRFLAKTDVHPERDRG